MPDAPIQCSPGALTAAENDRRGALKDRLSRAVDAVCELPHGYEFLYQPNGAAWLEVAEFVELERRCCPFFDFSARVGAADHKVSLSITGGPGVKEYLRSQIEPGESGRRPAGGAERAGRGAP